LVGGTEGKIFHSKCKWEDHIELYLKEINDEALYWIYVAQDGPEQYILLNTLMCFHVPQMTAKFLTSHGTISNSRRIFLLELMEFEMVLASTDRTQILQ
jgi:hypothetical protein